MLPEFGVARAPTPPSESAGRAPLTQLGATCLQWHGTLAASPPRSESCGWKIALYLRMEDGLLGSLQDAGGANDADAPTDDQPGKASTPPWARWWVLALYGVLSSTQSLLWITYSSVPASSESFFSTTQDTLGLWLNYGPIAFCVTCIPSLWLLHRSRAGLQLSIRLGLTLCTLASLLRLIPAWLPASQRGAPLALAVTHVAQFLNGAVAPLAVASPAYLSLVWFPDSERNLATALANTANALGRAIGFFLGPLLVSSAGDLPTLLYVTVLAAALPCAAAWAYLPDVPSRPPSAATAKEALRWAEAPGAAGGSSGDSAAALVQLGLRGALTQARAACGSPAFLLTAASGGAVMAFFGAWSGVLTAALTPPHGALSDGQAGLLGALVTFAGIAGGTAAGWATDRPPLRRSLRGVLGALALSSAALFLPLALALRAGGGPAWLTYPVVTALCTLGGALRGGMDPLYFELAAETAWEAGGGADVAGTFLTLIYHLLLCFVLSVPGAQLLPIVLPGMPVCLVAGALLLLPVRVAYTRRASGVTG